MMSIKTIEQSLYEHLPTKKAAEILALVKAEIAEREIMAAQPPCMMSGADIAREMGYHPNSFYRWLKSHPEVKRYKMKGDKYRLNRADIVALMTR